MSTYTKGPWFAGEPGSTREDYVKSARGNDVASVYPGDSDWDSGVAIANTNLIAAAPELLEALNSFPMLLGHASSAWGKQVQEWQDKALAAIAKAGAR